MIAKFKFTALTLVIVTFSAAATMAAPKGRGGGPAPAVAHGGGAPAPAMARPAMPSIGHMGGAGIAHPSFSHPSFARPSFARPAVAHRSIERAAGTRHFSAPSRLAASAGSARAARFSHGRNAIAARSLASRHSRESTRALAAARGNARASARANAQAARANAQRSASDLRSRRGMTRADARAAALAARRDAAAARDLRRSAPMAAAAMATGSIGSAFVANRNAHAGWYRNWRHHHRGFGWFGPVFWPYAYSSIFGTVFWPYAYGYDYDLFWDYGYGDIYTAMFYPYSYDELVSLPAPLRRRGVRVATRGNNLGPETMQRLSPLCGDDSREVAGVPVDEIQAAVSPNDAQRAALDELGNAAVKAAQIVKDACPGDIALTPTGRLEAMQRRVEAMIQAVATVRGPLEKFYDMLNDEQKARFDAIGQRPANTTSAAAPQSLMGKCSMNEATQWPTAEIERAVRPNEPQLASLNALKQAADQAANELKNACPAQLPVTPSARFDAISARLNAMLEAIKTVSGPLNDFYSSLSDEQRAQFNRIGRAQSSRRG